MNISMLEGIAENEPKDLLGYENPEFTNNPNFTNENLNDSTVLVRGQELKPEVFSFSNSLQPLRPLLWLRVGFR